MFMNEFKQLSVGNIIEAEEVLYTPDDRKVPAGTRGKIVRVEWRGTLPTYHTQWDNGIFMIVTLPWTVGKVR